MGAWIEIAKKETGEVRHYRDEFFDCSAESASEFLWTEGNYSCDCNRALFFARANGEPDPLVECGEVAYTAIKAICDDGTVVILDDD